jgi:hypothetical protein
MKSTSWLGGFFLVGQIFDFFQNSQVNPILFLKTNQVWLFDFLRFKEQLKFEF